LRGMSQEKCIQAMGRVGRNRLQHTYSIRFRDDCLIRRLFRKDTDRPEVTNMARLFVGDPPAETAPRSSDAELAGGKTA